MYQSLFNYLKVFVFFNVLFFCSTIGYAENVELTSASITNELSLKVDEIDLSAITEIDGVVVNPNLPIEVLYKKVKRARNIRTAGIVLTVCAGYVTLPIGVALLVVGCKQYRAYKKAGLDFSTVKYRYQQSLRNGVAPSEYTSPTPAYVPSTESGKD